MAKRLQFSVALRNLRLNQVEIALGTTAKLQLRAGTLPTNCAASDTGILLCEMTLPANWMNAANLGSKTMAGIWTGTGMPAAGFGTKATYFRLKQGTTTHCQGNVTSIEEDGAMELDDPLIVHGNPVTVTAFSLTDGNA